MKIYLCRHGEVEHNRLGVYSNQNEDLNSKGIEQAMELRKLVENIDYDVIYSSLLQRALHTAQLINVKDKIIVPIIELQERDPMELNGKPLSYTDRNEYWNYFSAIDYGAEPIQSFFNRVHGFIDSIRNRPFKNVLIVGHSGVSKAFYAYFNGIPEDGEFLDKGLKNCELISYELEKDGWL